MQLVQADPLYINILNCCPDLVDLLPDQTDQTSGSSLTVEKVKYLGSVVDTIKKGQNRI